MTDFASNKVIFPNTKIGKNVDIGPFAILGHPVEIDSAQLSSSGQFHWADSRGTIIEDNVVICSGVFIGDGSNIGEGSFLSHGIYIGHDVSIGQNVEVFHRAQIMNRVNVADGCWIGGFICNDVQIESEAVVYGKLIHKFVDAVRGIPEDPPTIGQQAFVGEGAIIIGGIHIGAGAYVAAGSVVTKNVPERTLVMGNPARECGRAPNPFKNPEARY